MVELEIINVSSSAASANASSAFDQPTTNDDNETGGDNEIAESHPSIHDELQQPEALAPEGGAHHRVVVSSPPILGMLPFTLGNQFNPSAPSAMAAGLLALDHFRQGNPQVVPELALAETTNCSSYQAHAQATIFIDTAADSTRVSEFLMQEVAFQWPIAKRPMAMVGVPNNDAALSAAEYAVGMKIPLVSSGADSTSLTNGKFFNGLGASTNVNLHIMGDVVMDYIVRRQGRRQVLATLATTHEFGADLRYAIDATATSIQCNDDDDDDDDDGDTAPCFIHHDTYGLAPPFGGYEPNRGAGYALQQIKKRGIRNIILVLNMAAPQLAPIANDAMELGFLDPERRGDYVWILAAERGQRLTELTAVAATNRNVSLLMNGMATVVPLDGFTYNNNNDDDPFLQAWRQQNETTVERLNQLYPIQKNTTPGYYKFPTDYFQTQDPEPGAGFFYDAMMTVALGKCAFEQRQSQQQQGKAKGKPPPTSGSEAAGGDGGGSPSGGSGGSRPTGNDKDDKNNTRRKNRRRGLKGVQQGRLPPGERQLQPPKKKKKKKGGTNNEFMKSILKVQFQGATGSIRYNENSRFPGSRSPDLVTYGVFNFRPKPINDYWNIDGGAGDDDSSEESPPPLLDVYLTDIHRGPIGKGGAGTGAGGEWITAPDGPFIYPNGLATPPLLNRDLPEQNYLSPAIHITGLFFMSIALLTAFASAALIILRSDAGPIRQAQPPFLLLLILGTILMALAMLTLSFDESYYDMTKSQLDAACVATPFLVFLGYNLIYLALFSKLYRINKVMQFRRVQITVTKVVAPFVITILLIVALLIAWAVTDPFQWVRSIIDVDTMESYGKCQSNNSLPFLIPLLCLLGLSTVACGVMAYKTRDIDERFSDSNYIFYTIFVQIQVLLVGIPILVILDDASADASYLGRALLIFVIVMTTLILMIAPKAIRIFVLDQEKKTSTRRGGGGGSGGVHVTGLSLVVTSGASTSTDVELSAGRSNHGGRR